MKRPSFFLYIKIKPQNKMGFTLVLPLFVIEMIFQGVLVWKHVLKCIFRKKINKLDIDINDAIEGVITIWFAVTSYREHDLVDVKAKDVDVKIKFI